MPTTQEEEESVHSQLVISNTDNSLPSQGSEVKKQPVFGMKQAEAEYMISNSSLTNAYHETERHQSVINLNITMGNLDSSVSCLTVSEIESEILLSTLGISNTLTSRPLEQRSLMEANNLSTLKKILMMIFPVTGPVWLMKAMLSRK